MNNAVTKRILVTVSTWLLITLSSMTNAEHEPEATRPDAPPLRDFPIHAGNLNFYRDAFIHILCTCTGVGSYNWRRAFSHIGDHIDSRLRACLMNSQMPLGVPTVPREVPSVLIDAIMVTAPLSSTRAAAGPLSSAFVHLAAVNCTVAAPAALDNLMRHWAQNPHRLLVCTAKPDELGNKSSPEEDEVFYQGKQLSSELKEDVQRFMRLVREGSPASGDRGCETVCRRMLGDSILGGLVSTSCLRQCGAWCQGVHGRNCAIDCRPNSRPQTSIPVRPANCRERRLERISISVAGGPQHQNSDPREIWVTAGESVIAFNPRMARWEGFAWSCQGNLSIAVTYHPNGQVAPSHEIRRATTIDSQRTTLTQDLIRADWVPLNR